MKEKTPVRAAVKAAKRRNQVEMMSILATGQRMSRGDVIMPRDIITMAVPVNAASGRYTEDIIGRKLKTSVTARKPIQEWHLCQNGWWKRMMRL